MKGGKRPGAGRKASPLTIPSETMAGRYKGATIAEFNRLRTLSGKSKSKALNEALEDWVKKERLNF